MSNYIFAGFCWNCTWNTVLSPSLSKVVSSSESPKIVLSIAGYRSGWANFCELFLWTLLIMETQQKLMSSLVATPPAPQQNEENSYELKAIRFLGMHLVRCLFHNQSTFWPYVVIGRDVSIVLQNVNGPCPLIAIGVPFYFPLPSFQKKSRSHTHLRLCSKCLIVAR